MTCFGHSAQRRLLWSRVPIVHCGKGRNFLRTLLILPYFYSVLFSLAMWNWNKGGFVCHIVKGRKIKQRGVKNCDSFQRRKKSEFMRLQGIPSFHDVFRPLLAGIRNFPTFSYQPRISETQTNVFRLLLFNESPLYDESRLFPPFGKSNFVLFCDLLRCYKRNIYSFNSALLSCSARPVGEVNRTE
jgi:hypothetical protein